MKIGNIKLETNDLIWEETILERYMYQLQLNKAKRQLIKLIGQVQFWWDKDMTKKFNEDAQYSCILVFNTK